jgi:CRP/FNR family transcriptional regulator
MTDRRQSLIAVKLVIDFFVQSADQRPMAQEAGMAITPQNDVGGPAIRALDPWVPGNPGHGKTHQLFTDGERARLAIIASVRRFTKGTDIYREQDDADAVFNIINGVVKAYTHGPGRDELVTAFLFPEDVFGLAQEGRYINSTKALTPVTAYRIPIAALRGQFSTDAALEFHVIAKLCHELRQAQRHAFVLASKHTVSKLTLFLQMLEQLQAAKGEPVNEIYLPMTRSDIAEYVGASLPAISRAFRALTTRGVLQVRNRQHVKILHHAAFELLTNDKEDSVSASHRIAGCG